MVVIYWPTWEFSLLYFVPPFRDLTLILTLYISLEQDFYTSHIFCDFDNVDNSENECVSNAKYIHYFVSYLQRYRSVIKNNFNPRDISVYKFYVVLKECCLRFIFIWLTPPTVFDVRPWFWIMPRDGTKPTA